MSKNLQHFHQIKENQNKSDNNNVYQKNKFQKMNPKIKKITKKAHNSHNLSNVKEQTKQPLDREPRAQSSEKSFFNNNYKNNLYKENENSKTPNDSISPRNNYNINQNITPPISQNIPINQNNNENNKDSIYININNILGERCKINLELIKTNFDNYEPSKTSRKNMGVVRSYGVNTFQGIVRNYNEDRVSIIINMNKPKNYNKGKWPKISFFGIYDGHGGEGCSEYLRDNLHKLICTDENFPENITQSIKNGYAKAEKDFINNYGLSKNKENIIDKSGSCAIIILIIDTIIYIANAGDSRCLLSMNDGQKYIEVTEDHKPNSQKEMLRITKNGGTVYQSQTPINNITNPLLNGKILIGPYRVLPGRLSVSRTIGDVEAKMINFGGNPNVIICEPDVYIYDLTKDNIDFFILGCDGIYDQMSSKEILDCAWMVLREKNNNIVVNNCNNLHDQSGLIVDFILKSALSRKSFDNVTCLFIALKNLGMGNNENKTKMLQSFSNVNNLNNNKPSSNSVTKSIINKIPTNNVSNINNKVNSRNPELATKKRITNSIQNQSSQKYLSDIENNNNNTDNKNKTDLRIRKYRSNIKLKMSNINNINNNNTQNLYENQNFSGNVQGHYRKRIFTDNHSLSVFSENNNNNNSNNYLSSSKINLGINRHLSQAKKQFFPNSNNNNSYSTSNQMNPNIQYFRRIVTPSAINSNNVISRSMVKGFIPNTPVTRGPISYNTRSLNSFDKNFDDISNDHIVDSRVDTFKIQTKLKKYKTATNFNTNNEIEDKNRNNFHFKLINNEKRNNLIENSNLINQTKQIRYARNKYGSIMDEKLSYTSLPNDNTAFRISERKITKSSGHLLNNFYNNHSITEINNVNNQVVVNGNVKTYRKIINNNITNKINPTYNTRKERNTFSSNMNNGIIIDSNNFVYQDY